MKNFKVFFGLFALIGAAMIFVSGCSQALPSSGDDETTATTDTSGYSGLYYRDGSDQSSDYLGLETLSSSDKVNLAVAFPSSVKVKYDFSDVVTSGYPTATSGSGKTLVLASGKASISNITSRYVVFTVFLNGKITSTADVDYFYWEVENYVQPSAKKIDITFAQAGTSLTISATDGTSVVPSAIVRYTLDGTDPLVSSTLTVTGTQTVTVALGVIVKAKCFITSTSYLDSDIESYTMTGTPVSSAKANVLVDKSYVGKTIQLWTQSAGTKDYTVTLSGNYGLISCAIPVGDGYSTCLKGTWTGLSGFGVKDWCEPGWTIASVSCKAYSYDKDNKPLSNFILFNFVAAQ